MMGILFLVIIFLVGKEVVYFFDDEFKKTLQVKGFSRKRVGLPLWWVTWPSSFLIGVLLLGWATYIFSYWFSYYSTLSMSLGNGLVFILALGFLFYAKKRRAGNGFRERVRRLFRWRGIDNRSWLGILFVWALTGIFALLFYYTFRVEGDVILVGPSVYSDFGPHIALIRSFSLGDNFPTLYPHYPAIDIRYHFMFDFVVGNLEYLGLRIDHAFNVLSILSLGSFLMLLFYFAGLISGRVEVGVLSLVLWFLRSSPAFFSFIYESGSVKVFVERLLGLRRFVGATEHEDWGLWNQNVYLNQRHLVFGWGVVLMMLVLLSPIFMEKRLSFFKWIRKRRPINFRLIVFGGLLLGSLGFFNGAASISGLLLLGGLLFYSREKNEIWGIMGLTLLVVWLQKKFFIEGGLLQPQILVGFLARERSLMGIVNYWFELLGVLVVLAPLSLALIKRRFWFLLPVFLAPLIFANLVSLTPDVAVNHKYVMLSVTLVNIFAAYFLLRVWGSNRVGRVLALILGVMLTATGLLDLRSIINLNRHPMSYEQSGSYWEFMNGTLGDSVFMTDDLPVLDTVLVSGRRVFYGWPYFAWSAGYDTNRRDFEMKMIYEEVDGKVFYDSLSRTQADYIVYRLGEPKNMKLAEKELFLVYEDKERKVFKIR